MTDAGLLGATLGALLLGIILGVLLVRWARQFVSYVNSKGDVVDRGQCSICQQEGFLVQCRRCRKQVAMCHSYYVCYPDNPDPKMLGGGRKNTKICTECLPAPAREVLDELAK